MNEAFQRLHPRIQEAIYDMGWQSLRQLQTDSIQAVLDGRSDLILAAATASGKTEAAFLPILSQMVNEPQPSVQAMYVSPLKALINDQFNRLQTLCEKADIPVHRWHGDVGAGEKRRLRESPSGVLLITPESLESLFINHSPYLPRIFSGLEYAVIDELHAFLSDVRGMHLRSLLARLRLVSGARPRKLGLSATLGDFGPAKEFLCREAPESVRVLEDEKSEKQRRVGVKAYIRPKSGKPGEGSAPDEDRGTMAEQQIAQDLAIRFRKDTNLVFCNSRSLCEELVDFINVQSAEEGWKETNPFRVHHGSLDRAFREEVETELKQGKARTVLCTRTLEMGIDIGAVKSVGQVGAPTSAASLIQRVGRSGRRDGEPQVLRMYTIDREITESSSLSERLYPDLLRSVALAILWTKNWAEAPDPHRRHYSTFIHQVLSVLRQTGGMQAGGLLKVLCTDGAFSSIEREEFITVLCHLASEGLIQQMETGHIILASEGESIAEGQDFYAAFAGAAEVSVETIRERIGKMPANTIPPVGGHLILGGRRWCVLETQKHAKRVLVEAATGRKKPVFLGQPGRVAREVMKQMEEVLLSTEQHSFLHETATAALTSARETYAFHSSLGPGPWEMSYGCLWLPWQGTSVHETLRLCALSAGLHAEVSLDGLAITYPGTSLGKLREHLRALAEGAFTADGLADHVPEPFRDRFDEHVPEDLLRRAYATEVLDLHQAMKLAGEVARR